MSQVVRLLEEAKACAGGGQRRPLEEVAQLTGGREQKGAPRCGCWDRTAGCTEAGCPLGGGARSSQEHRAEAWEDKRGRKGRGAFVASNLPDAASPQNSHHKVTSVFPQMRREAE